jgi:hypothetical protein
LSFTRSSIVSTRSKPSFNNSKICSLLRLCTKARKTTTSTRTRRRRRTEEKTTRKRKKKRRSRRREEG